VTGGAKLTTRSLFCAEVESESSNTAFPVVHGMKHKDSFTFVSLLSMLYGLNKLVCTNDSLKCVAAITLQWTSSGQQLLCQCGGLVKVLDIEQGRVTASVGVNEEEEESEDTINTFVLSPDNEQIISNHRSGLFKLWKWRGEFLLFLVTF
jgi:hypothetical protein